MKIAYNTHYIGKEFVKKYSPRNYSVASTLKSQSIARSLMKLGHQVIIYSSGINEVGAIIPPFEETEHYPEGDLVIKYSRIFSYHRMGPLTETLHFFHLLGAHWKMKFDAYIYYNINKGTVLQFPIFSNAIRIIDYEDNVFNRALAGGKAKFLFLKKFFHKRMIERTQGIFAVCQGMMELPIKNKVLTPGIINEEVCESVTNRINRLEEGRPVHLIISGGMGYDKGTDLLIQSLKYVKYPCVLDFYSNINVYEPAVAYLKELPEYHQVNFKGYKPHRELIQILDKEADILLCTTLTLGVAPQSAGFPSKMLEYCATGRPVVSGELAKLDEEFNSHITYFNEETPQSLAKAIEEVIEHYDEKVVKALELQRIVLSKYTIEGTSQRIGEMLEGINN